MATNGIPSGYHSVTIYLIVKDSKAAMAFYEKAFGAKEILRLTMPDGSIAHAEIKIGDTFIMLGDENADWGSKGPLMLGGSPVSFAIYVPDCDTAYARALAAGAKEERPVMDQFYGDRTGTVIDPFGHKWTLATHQKDMTEKEMQTAMDAWLATMMPPG